MASKRNLRREACEAKRRYDNPGAAYAAARRNAKPFPASGDLGAYRCPFCAGWNLGHPPRSGLNGPGPTLIRSPIRF